jgi:hypothetical protein
MKSTISILNLYLTYLKIRLWFLIVMDSLIGILMSLFFVIVALNCFVLAFLDETESYLVLKMCFYTSNFEIYVLVDIVH